MKIHITLEFDATPGSYVLGPDGVRMPFAVGGLSWAIVHPLGQLVKKSESERGYPFIVPTVVKAEVIQ